MSECEHIWKLVVDGPGCKECQFQAILGVAYCVYEGCYASLGPQEIERRLNSTPSEREEESS